MPRKQRKRRTNRMAEPTETQPKPRYQHEPLPDQEKFFRLLELLPGKEGTAIHCRLRTYSINFHPPYECISYVWGDPDDKTDIFCHRRRIRVPQNLHDALGRLRFRDESRILWADSICINQDDIKERGHQVQLMRQIFYRAVNVNSWLGRGDDFDAEAAFNLIQRLHEACETEDSCIIRRHIDDTPENEWHALDGLTECEYFFRVWILQEIGLAYDVTFYCGHNTLQSQALRGMNRAWLVNACVGNMLYYIQRPLQQLHFGFRNNRDDDVRSIINVSRYSACVDPRDRYYGILGHAAFAHWQESSKGAPFLTVDYTLPVADLYFNAAEKLLSLPNPLKLLALVQHTERDVDPDGVPSWVPQLHKEEQPQSLTTWAKRLFFTAGTQEATHFQQKERELSVTGIYVDSIRWTSTPIKEESADMHTIGEVVKSIWGNIRMVEKNKKTLALSRLCSTLTTDYEFWRSMINSEKVEQDIDTVLSDCRALLERETIFPDAFADWKADHGSGDAGRFIRDIKDCVYGRSFFIGTKGFFGLAPHVAEPGDDICIFFGAETPFVLTPTDRAGKYWLRGECYLEDWMHGKATGMWRPDEGKTFTLV